MRVLRIISIHTLTKRVTLLSFIFGLSHRLFQSTLSQREWHILFIFIIPFKFQSTLSQREWLVSVNRVTNTPYISIHTLTKRVTLENPERSGARKYFNPHSHKESDLRTLGLPRWLLHFNPHSHKESDVSPALRQGFFFQFQSTLSQREWRSIYPSSLVSQKFQSTLSQREWQEYNQEKKEEIWFQSTLSQREWRRSWWFGEQIQNYFNPHSHKESDVIKINNSSVPDAISIHTLTKRVTKSISRAKVNGYISIHTLTKRVTEQSCKSL